MKPEWKNTEPFKQHIEEMASFRRHHPRLTPAQPEREIPDTSGSITPYQADSANFYSGENRNNVVVPIWDVILPDDSQN